jgi:aspartate aminotransferase
MQLSDRVNRIEISPTVAVVAEAERLRARGVDLVDFGPGEPDFPTPDHIKQAAVRALEENKTKYTPTGGILPLREAITAWHSQQFGTAYAPSECIVTVGGKHAIFNAICALINRGDEVVIPAPYWVSFPDIVKYAGGEPVHIPTEATEGFRLRAAQLERAITTRTRIVIINSPSNPSGAVIDRAEFERIFELCRRRKVWLMTDECYSHFLYDGLRPFSIAALPEAKENVLVVGSVSKTFAMTGWRIGYALAPAPLIQAMLKLQSQSTSNPTSIAQYAALAALTGPMDTVEAMRAEYERRRTRVLEGLAKISGMACPVPQGAFYVFPDVSALLAGRAADTAELAKQLLEREHVIVVPGEAFGTPGHLRISYATSVERMDEGLRRLQRFFAAARSAP